MKFEVEICKLETLINVLSPQIWIKMVTKYMHLTPHYNRIGGEGYYHQIIKEFSRNFYFWKMKNRGISRGESILEVATA